METQVIHDRWGLMRIIIAPATHIDDPHEPMVTITIADLHNREKATINLPQEQGLQAMKAIHDAF